MSGLKSLIRIANSIGHLFEKMGIHFHTLDQQKLMDKARNNTGLDDFGEDGFREGLDRMLQSIEKDSPNSTLGRFMLHANILRILEFRLKMEDHHKKHPEILEEKIERPIFIVGLPRTGTTILHGLLSVDPNLRHPKGWESGQPYPPPTPETYLDNPRIDFAEKNFKALYDIAPELKKIHYMEATDPQECLILNAFEFRGYSFLMHWNAPEYEQWLKNLDRRPVYKKHKRLLQFLQSGGVRGKHWLLKTPFHLGHVEELLDVYPDAIILNTHRDPLKVLPSIASLIYHFRKVALRKIDKLTIGKQQLQLWETYLNRFLKFRQENDLSNNVYDLFLEDFVQDPIGKVESIYAHFGLEYSDELRKKMEEYMANHERYRFGKHEYKAAEYGIESGDVKARFAKYYSFLEAKGGKKQM